ncbi:E3 ubiquitin- protein ligase [Datura stramonium]|uniref:E3 ubiquitin- protein ligase n=1 Tax=Datura stramonium TaxID=4076 RepID=A0ABS8T579_DATST|nr:E3 ubiquitin- protein ligase [Datura stramonium]
MAQAQNLGHLPSPNSSLATMFAINLFTTHFNQNKPTNTTRPNEDSTNLQPEIAKCIVDTVNRSTANGSNTSTTNKRKLDDFTGTDLTASSEFQAPSSVRKQRDQVSSSFNEKSLNQVHFFVRLCSEGKSLVLQAYPTDKVEQKDSAELVGRLRSTQNALVWKLLNELPLNTSDHFSSSVPALARLYRSPVIACNVIRLKVPFMEDYTGEAVYIGETSEREEEEEEDHMVALPWWSLYLTVSERNPNKISKLNHEFGEFILQEDKGMEGFVVLSDRHVCNKSDDYGWICEHKRSQLLEQSFSTLENLLNEHLRRFVCRFKCRQAFGFGVLREWFVLVCRPSSILKTLFCCLAK